VFAPKGKRRGNFQFKWKIFIGGERLTYVRSLSEEKKPILTLSPANFAPAGGGRNKKFSLFEMSFGGHLNNGPSPRLPITLPKFYLQKSIY
jgi:hypothetical protein